MSVKSQIKYDKDVVPLPNFAVAVLRRVMDETGVQSVRVTRTISTPQQQARIMFDNCEANGVEAQKKLYASNGDKVIDVYMHYNGLKAKGADRETVIASMAKKIIELGPENVSKHCVLDPKKSVFDIAPSSIPDDKKEEFQIALGLNLSVKRFFYPPDDPALHIEIEKAVA
jgi:hypothetical protein